MALRFLNAGSYTIPVVASVIAHLGLLAMVAWGWQAAPHEPKVMAPKYIEAKLVQLKASTPKETVVPKPQPKKIDVAAERKEKERIQREQESKRKAEQAKKVQAEKAQKEKEKERIAKEKAEKDRKDKEQKLAEQQRIEDQLNDLLAEEDELIQAEQAEVAAQSYFAMITNRIKQNWSRPPSARNGMKCIILIQLVPTGRVVNVSIKEGSGNSAFDRSAEQAVWKAEQFTELQGMDSVLFEKYFRQFPVVFDPQDLRL